MSREIKFRGLRTDGKGWVYGDLMTKYIHHKGLTIVEGGCVYYEVTPESVGQFTGLKDKNGVEIYEGDKVRWGMYKSLEHWHRYAVVFINPDIQFKIFKYVDSETNEDRPGDDYIFHFGKFAYKETEEYLEITGKIHEQ